MARTRRATHAAYAILLLLVCALFGFTDWARIAGYRLLTRGGQDAGARLHLDAYRASLQAYPVTGLHENASGLTYNPTTGTLFAIVNRPPTLAELSTNGRLLRTFALHGVSDTEGITHVQGNVFVVSDEEDNSLHWFRIVPETNTVEALGEQQPDLGFEHQHNRGLEGLSWDPARNELLLVNEKSPREVSILSGVQPQNPATMSTAHVRSWQPKAWLGPLGRDLASLTVVPDTGNLLLLSEASGVITEYSHQGDVLGVLLLWHGTSGLIHAIPQPEGVALGPEGTIYVLSEPNLFYRFEKAAP